MIPSADSSLAPNQGHSEPKRLLQIQDSASQTSLGDKCSETLEARFLKAKADDIAS